MGAIPGINPVILGLVAAVGGTLGELTGYMLGYSGRVLVENKDTYTRATAWIKKWGVLAILVFALAPVLPLDIAGIAAGNLRFPLWKFMGVCWIGKAILYVLAAYAGVWGWEIVFPFFG
jgi:membrane protein YqaA with SNARE-associated domain